MYKSYSFHFLFSSFTFSHRNPAKIIYEFWYNRRRIVCWCAAQTHFDRCATCIKSTQPRMHWRQRNRAKRCVHTIRSTIRPPFLSVSVRLVFLSASWSEPIARGHVFKCPTTIGYSHRPCRCECVCGGAGGSGCTGLAKLN